jgi:hypothetical protein
VGALRQPGLSQFFTTPPPDCASAIVKFRSVSVVTVGTPLHVNMLAVSLLVWKYLGPPVRDPHHHPAAPAPPTSGVVASRQSPALLGIIARKPQDGKLPSRESSKGDQRYSADLFQERQHSRPSRCSRLPIGPAYAQSVKVVFSGGFKPPCWTFGSLLVTQRGWLFRDIQGRTTPAAGAPGAATSLTVSVSVACLVYVVIICTDRVTPSYVF